jgi:hypothetical protein
VTAASRLKITPIGLNDLWKGGCESAGKIEQEVKYNGKGNLLLAYLYSLSLSLNSLLHSHHEAYFQSGTGRDLKGITML